MQRNRTRRGFTLVEILIVVVILGILAAIVTPQFSSASEETRQQAFISEMRVFVEAAEYFRAREGVWVSDGSSGTCPDEFAAYVDSNQFEGGTPIGGVWDIEFNDSGVTQAIGVHFNDGDAQPDTYMTEIDAIFDDGALDGGVFQQLATDRFYYIIQD